SVDPTWRAYFESRGRGPEAHRAWHPATPHPSPPPHAMAGGERGKKADPRGNGAARAREMSERVETAFAETPGKSPSPGEQAVLAQAAIQARVYQLLNAYRVRGHLYADLDPLSPQPPERAELDLSNFGLHAGDIDKPFPT